MSSSPAANVSAADQNALLGGSGGRRLSAGAWALRFLLGLSAVVLLLAILVIAQTPIDQDDDLTVLRPIQSAPALPAPPEPLLPEALPEPEVTPPSPIPLPTPELTPPPAFDAPALVKAEASKTDIKLPQTKFLRQTAAPRASMTFEAKDLDQMPRLLNRPSVRFPSSQRKAGVREGKVTLEVTISRKGSVTVHGVRESSHPDFEPMAIQFAERARFSSPVKDGRSVQARFVWPLTLKP